MGERFEWMHLPKVVCVTNCVVKVQVIGPRQIKGQMRVFFIPVKRTASVNVGRESDPLELSLNDQAVRHHKIPPLTVRNLVYPGKHSSQEGASSLGPDPTHPCGALAGCMGYTCSD